MVLAKKHTKQKISISFGNTTMLLNVALLLLTYLVKFYENQ